LDTDKATTDIPNVYSVASLFSLRPLADDSMKEKIRIACPEVVMTRKIRKGLEFNGRKKELLAAQQSAPALESGVTETKAAATLTPTPLRVPSRRNRPAGRAPERRRNAFGSRRGLSDDSWRLQAATVLLL
jgi:hypothetical protein